MKIKKVKKVMACMLLLLVPVAVSAQQISYTFDDQTSDWKVKKGKAEAVEQGAYKGKAMRLNPNTILDAELTLQPASTYKLTAWIRTESGADNVTLQLNRLGKNNISITTALAAWTKYERTFHVSADQHIASLEFVFGNTSGNTHAWIDEVTVERVGDYKETVYTGIPDAPVREVKTDLDIRMQSDEKMQWMLDGKLGMFIHWGLYAGPGQGEWYMENQAVAPEKYRELAYPESGDRYFDAKHFDARKWAVLAKKSGMKYMNMVTQHHDGYALFESKYINTFTSKQTHNKDFVRAYVAACREQGLKVGLYKTLINWRFPGYFDVMGTDCKPNRWGYTTDPSHKENARLMKEELYCQIKELMTGYGPIDQLFWDGGWLSQQGTDADAAYFWESGKYQSKDSEWLVNPYFQDKDDAGKPLGLMGIIRKYQPNILVNPRSGWIGDYTCEEGTGAVKGDIRSGVVEKCLSISAGWGYTPEAEDSERVMSLKDIKRIFADCLVRNMCLMINIGPDRHGQVPKGVEKRLLEFGDWVNATSEAIYGTRGGPWQPVDGQYGFCYKENIIYIYFLGDFSADTFTLPPVNKGMKALKAYNVYTQEKVNISQKGQHISLKKIAPEQNNLTVIAVVLNKKVR